MKQRWNGFTLVETLVTLAIMSTLTVMTARTIQQALKSKVKIQDQIDNVTQIRDVVKLMEKDIQLAYHASDLEKELAILLAKAKQPVKSVLPNPLINGQQLGQQPGQPPIADETPNIEEEQLPPDTSGKPQNPYLQTEHRIPPNTNFIGKESEMHFVTSNVIRIIKDSPQSDTGEVGYFLDSCKQKTNKDDDGGKCLYRRFSPIVDKDVTKGGRAQQLMEHVLEFQLKYYSKKAKDWVTEWRSDEKGDANTKGFFPEAVEINITMQIPKKEKSEKERKMSVQLMVPIHFTNNPEIKK